MEEYEKSKLWQRTLADQGETDLHRKARERLRQAFERFREKAQTLAGEIPQGIRELTVHDVTHMDALWELTDQIAGEDYPINAAEAFVLGGAFLLHDLGMALAAYPGGLEELTQTPQWADALLAQLRRQLGRQPSEAEVASAPEDVVTYATETALRVLHAERAESLPTTTWSVPTGQLHLIADDYLRLSWGPVVGRIAYSHWWDLARVDTELRERMGAPTFCPSEWQVDPLKLACILRVVDACHCDQRRAPLLLRAFRRPSGVAAEHWGFQAKLTKPIVKEGRVFFTSSAAFAPEEAADWWRGHELLTFADRELRDVDALLADLAQDARPRFLANSVAYVHHPKRLAQHVKTLGWTPVDTRIRVSDVPELVRRFGGEALYGDDPTVPLRELIQNAADAIRARRVVQGLPDGSGTITVLTGEDETGPWIEVQDTGLGMTEDVLTGPFLDFGASYWGSALMQQEFPGLLAAGFESTGRFGIGFFSVFMWGDRVRVATRSVRGGPGDTLSLDFEQGSDHPPLLRTPPADAAMPEPGTRVKVWYRPHSAGEWRLPDWAFEPTGARLRATCEWLAPALDVTLQAGRGGGEVAVAVRAGDWLEVAPSHLVRRSRATVGGPEAATDDTQAPWMQRIVDCTGATVGRAAVSCGGRVYVSQRRGVEGVTGQGVLTAGGLRVCGVHGVTGVLCARSTDLARGAGKLAVDAHSLADWASQQALLAGPHKLPEEDQQVFAACARACGGDTGDLAIALGQSWLSAVDLAAWDPPPVEVLVGSTTLRPALKEHGVQLDPCVLLTHVPSDISGHVGASGPMVGIAKLARACRDEDGLPSGEPSLLGAVIEALARSWGATVADVRASSSLASDPPRRKRRIGVSEDGGPWEELVYVLRKPQASRTQS